MNFEDADQVSAEVAVLFLPISMIRPVHSLNETTFRKITKQNGGPASDEADQQKGHRWKKFPIQLRHPTFRFL